MSLLRLDHIGRTYDMGHVQVEALRDVSMTVEPGEMVAIVGPSGSGKTTMMSIIGCLDRPTNGRYELDGTDVGSLDEAALARIRSRTIGFVFQSYNLLPGTSAVDNVATPLLYQGVPRRERQARAAAELERLGMGASAPPRADRAVRRRAAAGRACARPRDEARARSSPTSRRATSPCDQGLEVMQLFQELHAAGHTILLITHNPEVAEVAQPARPPPRRRDRRRGRGGGMSLLELVRLALSRLRRGRVRAALTMLGVIIGVASVVGLVSVGRGTTARITQQLSNLGTNLLTISPSGGGR